MVAGTPLFFIPIQERHDEANDYSEQDSTKGPRQPHLPTKDPGSEDDGEHVDRRARIEKGHRGPQAGPSLVNTGKQGQDCTRAYRKNGAGDGGTM